MSQPTRAFRYYAVNVYDLTKHREFLDPVRLLLAPLLTRETAECEGDRWDGDSVLVRREVPPKRMAAVLQVLRVRLGRGKASVRVYGSDSVGSRSWTRLTCPEPAETEEDETEGDRMEGGGS